ncbi:hypothetical protein ACQ5SP_02285 [Rhodovulum sp. YNF3179]|uniref:hypothetical protein n=1 Tax=Rhodovulum sp. YNF3179 TaxID=3425127 RepID=UPI003D34A3CC
MTRTPPKSGSGDGKPGKPATDRETRLKAALRANLRRRKAQARARKPADGAGDKD